MESPKRPASPAQSALPALRALGTRHGSARALGDDVPCCATHWREPGADPEQAGWEGGPSGSGPEHQAYRGRPTGSKRLRVLAIGPACRAKSSRRTPPALQIADRSPPLQGGRWEQPTAAWHASGLQGAPSNYTKDALVYFGPRALDWGDSIKHPRRHGTASAGLPARHGIRLWVRASRLKAVGGTIP